ncbi:hypothetical protein ACFXA2_13510 [Micromonospora chalcea]
MLRALIMKLTASAVPFVPANLMITARAVGLALSRSASGALPPGEINTSSPKWWCRGASDGTTSGKWC